DRFDKRQAQVHQALLQQGRLVFVQISLGLGFEHFKLINEQPGGIEVFDDLSGLRMGDLAQEHTGHIGLLHDQLCEKNRQLVLAPKLSWARFGSLGFAHGSSLLRLVRISASKKWMSRRSRASTSTVSRMVCRSTAPGSTAQET